MRRRDREVTDFETIVEIYVHGAMTGRKFELMNKNKKCSFGMDIPLEMDCIVEKKDVTMRYKCVMGTAEITFLEGEEKQNAIELTAKVNLVVGGTD